MSNSDSARDDESAELVPPTNREALFEDVYGQLHRLHMHWWMYVTFFGNQNAIDTVRRIASRTFGEIQVLLVEAIVLDLTRLTAHTVNQQGKRNACVEALFSHGRDEDTAAIRLLRKRLDSVRNDLDHVKAWRDRVVAHRSEETALVGPPPPIYHKTVRTSLTVLSSILQAVSDLYGMNLPCDFGPDAEPDLFDADTLLASLKPFTDQ